MKKRSIFPLTCVCSLLHLHCGNDDGGGAQTANGVGEGSGGDTAADDSVPDDATPDDSVPDPTGNPMPSSTDADSEPDPPASAELGYTPCDPSDKVGEFRIDVAPDYPSAAQFSSVSGSVADGVVPVLVPEVVAEEGECRLLRNPSLSCDPTCSVSETCSDSGCIPYPASQDVGDVSIVGLKVEMNISPSGRNSYSNPATPMLPHPGFDPGDAITLQAAGGDYEAFTLRGSGISQLAVPNDQIQVNEDAAVSISWTAPSDAGPARMALELNLDNHGVSSARIQCVTDDDGSFDVPATLVSQLMQQGLSGFPSLTFRRQTVDSTAISLGCVELVVVSELVLEVDVEGLITCSSDEDCPDSQSCQSNLSCG